MSITSIDFFMVQSYCSYATWKNIIEQYFTIITFDKF